MKNLTTAFLAVVAVLVGTVNAAVVCPSASAIAPCSCVDSGDGITSALNCVSVNLNDTMASSILNTFLTTSGASALSIVSMKTNLLTTVPPQIQKHTLLTQVDLSFNTITLVRGGSFFFTNTLKSLNLDSNTLATISPGAFNGTGYGSGSKITLTTNSLTSFSSGVFQSVLEGMATGGNNLTTYIDIAGSSIDCSSVCPLAWLIRDNPNLLNFVQNAKCSNGKAFKELVGSPLFDACPITCPKTNGAYLDGNYADPMATPSSCGKFYQCSKGTAYTFECSDAQADLVFNPETKVCDTLINVPSCIAPFTCTSPYGNFPKVPASCTSYWLCADSVAYEQTCPGTLVFNPTIKQCDKITNVPSCNVKKVPFKLFRY